MEVRVAFALSKDCKRNLAGKLRHGTLGWSVGLGPRDRGKKIGAYPRVTQKIRGPKATLTQPPMPKLTTEVPMPGSGGRCDKSIKSAGELLDHTRS